MFQLRLILAIPVIFAALFAKGQETDTTGGYDPNFPRYTNHIYKESIHTPMLYRKGHEMSYPFMDVSGKDTLVLTFDDLGESAGNYSYTIEHCDHNWNSSGLSPNDFIDGFSDNPVKDYSYSFNTLVPYIHYRLEIPNEDMRPKLSGNYLLKIYEDSDPEKPVLTRRFLIVETKTDIDASVKRATLANLMKSHHEIDFTLKTAFTCNDPYKDIFVILSQNFRWDNILTDLKPLFIKDNELIYDFEDGNVFPAGNEFRYFDAKSIRYQSERIAKTEFIKPMYHVTLLPDEPRPFKIYFQWQDINGKFLIRNTDGQDPEVEADYIMVHFSLPYEAPRATGKVYVSGLFCDWKMDRTNCMTYNYEKKAYELDLLLKQGFYDYQYILLEDGQTAGDASIFEGNHYEADNDYTILVYWHDITSRYDRLVGLRVINSRVNK